MAYHRRNLLLRLPSTMSCRAWPVLVVVRIRYVHKDVQQLHSLLDRQRWTYDEATSSWWLESGMPRFGIR